MKLGAVLAVLALSVTGCPVVVPSDPINVTVHGRKIAVEAGDVDFLVPGETTRGEVVARLGAPYTVLTTPPVLVYAWRVLERHLGWGLVMYRAGIPLGTTPVYRDDTLLVALDEAGKVRRAEIVVRNTAEHTEREHAYRWAQRRGLCGERPTPRFTPQPGPPDRGTLYVYRPHALWQSYAAVNVSLADVVVAQLRKGEYFRTTLPPGEYRVRIAEFGVPVALEAGRRRFLRASPPNADDVPAFTDEVEAIEELTSIMFPIVPAL